MSPPFFVMLRSAVSVAAHMMSMAGSFGIGMALVAEAWPAAKRAQVSSYVGLGWQSGVLAAALVTPLLLPVIGWRGMFLIGIFPAIAAYFIRFLVIAVEEGDALADQVASRADGDEGPLVVLRGDGHGIREHGRAGLPGQA